MKLENRKSILLLSFDRAARISAGLAQIGFQVARGFVTFLHATAVNFKKRNSLFSNDPFSLNV